MTTRPHDIADLYLAPLALHLDASLERLSGKSPEELDLEVAMVTNREPKGAADRREALLDTVTHLVDMQGWTASWHVRGLHLAHDEHSMVLGIPASLRTYLQA